MLLPDVAGSPKRRSHTGVLLPAVLLLAFAARGTPLGKSQASGAQSEERGGKEKGGRGRGRGRMRGKKRRRRRRGGRGRGEEREEDGEHMKDGSRCVNLSSAI